MVPVDDIILAQNNYMTLAFAFVRLLNQHGEYEFVQVKVELFFGAFVAQLVQKASQVLAFYGRSIEWYH